jgi:hypothetical protein
MIHRYGGLILTLLVLIAGCAVDPTDQSTSPSPAPLVVLEAAREVKRSNDYDGTVSYSIYDPYPGSVVRDIISQTLARDGWKTTIESVLPKSTGSEDPNEWGSWLEGKKRVTQLIQNYKNSSGDLVMFVFRYETPADDPNRHDLHVTAMLTRKATIERLRRMQ